MVDQPLEALLDLRGGKLVTDEVFDGQPAGSDELDGHFDALGETAKVVTKETTVA